MAINNNIGYPMYQSPIVGGGRASPALNPYASQYYGGGWGAQDYQQQQQAQQQPMTNIIWVQGETGAKSYLVPNGYTYALWDSEQQTIYLKTVDNSGRPSLSVFDYVDRNAPAEPEKPPMEYVTQEQLSQISDDLTKQIAELQKKLNDFKAKVGNTRKGGQS